MPPLWQDALRPAPSADRARRPGRVAADHRHRLPQGGLSRLVLDHPQVRPRCDRLDHLRGQLAKNIAKVSRALEQPYEELLQDLPDQDRLNVDETGHKQNGQPQWIWCFRAGLYALFKIDPTRSGDVLIDVLGTEFDGVLGCDYFSAYRRYHREFGVVLQFCLAHLIRDVKFLTTLPGPQDRAYGRAADRGPARLFGVIHRTAEFSAAEFQRRLEAARAEVLHLGTRDVPATEPLSQPSEAVRDAWGELFPVHHDPGSGADQQPGGASDPVRGDRSSDHAGDEE